MKVKNRSKLFAMATALVALAAVWSLWGASRAQAVIAIVVPGDSFGIAQGQTARLNIVNSGEERGLVTNWKFLDSEGHTLAQSEERVMIPPGKMMSFDVSADELDATRDRFGRIQMRAVVMVAGNRNDIKRDLHVSAEVFDEVTGITIFATASCTNNL